MTTNIFKSKLLFFTLFTSLYALSCKKDKELPEKIEPIIIYIDTLEKKETIQIKVSNIKEVKGTLKVALYDNEENFNNSSNPVKTAEISVDKNVIEYVFENIEINKYYAIAVHHDANNNGEIDKNIFGIPKEGFCFSNNAMGSFGPPTYNDCKFEVKKGTSVLQDLKLIFF